jgi:glutamate carboxypeptidase
MAALVSAQLTSTLTRRLPETLAILERMVAINSFTANKSGVIELAALTAETFAPLGFTAETIPSTNPDWAPHLVLTKTGHSPQAIMMVSHLDTVFPPEEEARNNFRWSQEGDRIFGPGTHDIKGGTALMWLVLTALRELAPEAFHRVTWKLCFNSSEECLSQDFGDVCRQRLTPQTLAALVFESEGRNDAGQPCLVQARKGRLTWRASVRGRGAHAGSFHHHGANAVVQLARVIERINALNDPVRHLTVNPATISGGTVLNRVPHEAVVEGELRALDPATLESARSALLALRGPGDVKAVGDGFPCEIAVEILSESRAWPRNADTDRIAAIWQRVSAAEGTPLVTQTRGGLSDGNLIWDAVPTLDGLGPYGENSHCSERSADGTKLPEFVEVSSFVPKARINVLAILELLRSAPQA